MSNLSKVKLQDVATIQTGKLDSNAAVENGLYPFFTCDPKTLSIDTWAYDTEAVLLAGNNASGNYTAKYYCGKFNAYQRTYIIESKFSDILNTKFLSYAINQQLCLLKSMSAGSTTKFLTMRMLNNLSLFLPSVAYQNRIASILSAYDDLIENNQKQIKLLEEAAQRLYKEWFVDLRFPGWENTKIVDGMPEGWEKKRLHTIVDINRQLLLKNNTYTCMNYIDISSVQMGAILKKTEYNKNNLPNRAKRIAKHGDVIWGMVRPNLKSYALVLSPNANDVFSTGFSILSATKVPFSYLYYTVIQDSFVKYLVNCTNGSTYPAVKPLDFAQAKILLPTADLLTSFHSITEPLLRKKDVISKQIKLLEKGRNVLIHKFFDYETEENI